MAKYKQTPNKIRKNLLNAKTLENKTELVEHLDYDRLSIHDYTKRIIIPVFENVSFKGLLFRLQFDITLSNFPKFAVSTIKLNNIYTFQEGAPYLPPPQPSLDKRYFYTDEQHYIIENEEEEEKRTGSYSIIGDFLAYQRHRVAGTWRWHQIFLTTFISFNAREGIREVTKKQD